MAYKYFTKQVIASGLLDFSSVFPEKQRIAQEQNNVSYSLPEIVSYLQSETDGFKFYDQKYIDIDNAIRAIIAKWYTSINERNPFEDEGDDTDDETFVEGNTPRPAAIVNDGRTKDKGSSTKAPASKVPSTSAIKNIDTVVGETVQNPVAGTEEIPPLPVSVPVTPASEPVVIATEPPVIVAEEPEAPTQEQIRDAIEALKFLLDDEDEEQRIKAQEGIEALELLLE